MGRAFLPPLKVFPIPGKPLRCGLEQQPQADSRQIKNNIGPDRELWDTPPHTHPFHYVPKITFPNLFRNSWPRLRSRLQPCIPWVDGEGPGLLIAFVPPGVWGRRRVTCVFWGSWAIISLRLSFSSSGPLSLLTDRGRRKKPAERLTVASIPPVQILMLLIFPSSVFLASFSACGCWPTARPGSLQEGSHRRGLARPC